MNQEIATLKGKIAVVTGGSKGIGRSIALSLARQGADLITSVGLEDRDRKLTILSFLPHPYRSEELLG
jgi:NAD(P)-dependent dehydrogenase (short-subunit alcohol dehydrogenase family)